MNASLHSIDKEIKDKRDKRNLLTETQIGNERVEF